MNKEYIAVAFGVLLVGGLAWAGGANFSNVVASLDGVGQSLVAGAGTLIDKPAPVTLSGAGAKAATIVATAGTAKNEAKDVIVTTFALVSTEPTYVSSVAVNVIKTGPATVQSASLYIGTQKLASAQIPTQTPGKAFALQFPLDRNLELLSGDRRVLTVKADVKGAIVTPSVFRASVAATGIKGTPSSPLVVKGLAAAVPITIKTAPVPVVKPVVKTLTPSTAR